MGLLHWGFADARVADVSVEVDGEAPLVFPVARAPNVDATVYLLSSPPGVEEYALIARDEEGCELEREPVSVTGGPPAPPPAAAPACAA